MSIFQTFQIMAQWKGGASGGPPTQVNKLDNMLGSLQSDLHKLGVQTVAKGVCGACCKPIVGQVSQRCEFVMHLMTMVAVNLFKIDSPNWSGGDCHGPHMAP